MPARSFLLDLQQLTFDQFRGIYSWGSTSEQDFMALKSFGANARPAGLIAAGNNDLDTPPFDINVSSFVVTKLYVSVRQANTTIGLAFGTTASPMILGTFADQIKLLEMDDLDLCVDAIRFTVVAGSPDISYAVFGYNPAVG